jgi:Mg2+ and Co2+ transporter CorA
VLVDDGGSQNLKEVFCFKNDIPSRQRFIEELNRRTTSTTCTENMEHIIKNIIQQFVLDDILMTLSDFREVLDFVDLAMSSDIVLRNCLQNWRTLFGRWRKGLSHYGISTAYVLGILHHERTSEIESVEAKDSQNFKDKMLSPSMVPEFENLAQDVEEFKKRAESTFQALMSTMAIVESQKAIAQAEAISKLTNLAFVFVPLTLSASLFGMNVVVSISSNDSRLKRR